ncbi:hypothetical protein PQX77_012035 [Marasmius sp. AFHP31]|nr:hypothetical protein PQX77_012035 [Marasmius sp. AFHP31]
MELDISPAQFQRDLDLNYYCNLVSFTLLYYEYIITFGAEVSRIWAHTSLNAPTVIFYLNRYVGGFGHIPIVLEYFWTAPGTPQKAEMWVVVSRRASRQHNADLEWSARCHKLQSYHQYYAVLVQIMVAGMLITRTYALYERNKKVLAGMLLFTTGAIIHGGWAVYTAKSDEQPHVFVPHVGCSSGVGAALGGRLAAAWLGMLLFDTMIFLLTLFRALRMGRIAGNLLRLIVRDGSLYYAVMIVCNLANILTFYMGDRLIRGLLTTFTNVMSSILISRLVLHLRDPKVLQGTQDSTTVPSNQVAPTLSTLDPNTVGTNYTASSSFSKQTCQTESSASKSRTTASSMFTESSSGSDGDTETRTRFGRHKVRENRIDEESIREEPIELKDLSNHSNWGQGHV